MEVQRSAYGFSKLVCKFLDVPSEHALQHPSGKIRNRYLRSIIQRERGVAALLDIEKLFNAIKLA